MKASEAREKTKAVNNNSENGQLSEVLEAINKAIQKGEYSTWYYRPLLSDVKARLRQWGYKVDEQQDRNDTLVKIDWSSDFTAKNNLD